MWAWRLVPLLGLSNGKVLGYHLRLVLGLVLHLRRSHVLGDVLGVVLCLVLGRGNVLGLVLGIGDVLGCVGRRGDVIRTVLGLVLVFCLRDVLDIGFVHRFRDVLGDVLRHMLGVVVGDVLCLVDCGWHDLGMVDRLVNRDLEEIKENDND